MDRDEILALVEERDIKFIRLWFTDILGQLKSFAITREGLADAMDQGMSFDGSSITGFNAVEESDMMRDSRVSMHMPLVAANRNRFYRYRVLEICNR